LNFKIVISLRKTQQKNANTKNTSLFVHSALTDSFDHRIGSQTRKFYIQNNPEKIETPKFSPAALGLKKTGKNKILMAFN